MTALFISKIRNVCKEYYVGKKETDFDNFSEGGGGVFVFTDYGRFFLMMKCSDSEHIFATATILN